MTYQHPGDNPVSGMSAQLGAADLAWLTRLPTDPACISLEDGQVLAGMSTALAPGSADKRLVDSIWLPLNDFHDTAQAADDLVGGNTTTDTTEAGDPAAVAELLASLPDVLLRSDLLTTEESDTVVRLYAQALGISEPSAEQIAAERTSARTEPTPTPVPGSQGRQQAARRFGSASEAPPPDTGPGSQGRAMAARRFGPRKPSPGQ